MPELPEVETARLLLHDHALGRRIVDVDDADTFVCRPHAPGEIRSALLGRTLTAARRRGKSLWCETSGRRGGTTPGPDLGLHLGMAGRILVDRVGVRGSCGTWRGSIPSWSPPTSTGCGCCWASS